MTLQDILKRLNNVEGNGRGYKAVCPVHSDEGQGLSIWVNKQGRVEFKCKSICKPQWVLDSIGLIEQDLLPDSNSTLRPKTKSDSVEDRKGDDQDKDSKTSGGRRPQSTATRLVELASDAEFFHSPDEECYARIQFEDHYEVWPVKSNKFRHWLSGTFYNCFNSVPNGQAIQDALGLLKARALYGGDRHQIHRRVAEHEGNIYLDLCDEKWRSVKITAIGWKIINDTPVRFHRAHGMLALPEPQKGGSIDDLWPFYNIERTDRGLTKALIHAYYRPRGPYPICALHGEQGTAKSTNARVLRDLIDPNKASLRCEPKNTQDLMIAANNGWIIVLDNLSRIPEWLSDALCRLATGTGFSTRKLFSDSDETIFNAQRPIILTGIENIVTKSDLLDRSIVFDLPVISEESRRAEEDFWHEFEKARPRIIGAFLDAVSAALQNISRTKLEKFPRMADFAKWVVAGEEALGFEKGEFIELYTSNRQFANTLALEGSPISSAVIKLLGQTNKWEGTATELLTKLDSLVSDGDKRLRSWPKSPKALSGTLKRLAPNLRAAGINFTNRPRTGSRRIMYLEKVYDSSSLSSSSSLEIENQQVTGETANGDMT